MKLCNFFKKKKNKDKDKNKDEDLLPEDKVLSDFDYTFHRDVEDLVWFRNGPKENYNPKQNAVKDEFYLDGFNLTIDFSLSDDNEPSAIDTGLVVGEFKDLSEVEKLRYFPSYSLMTSSQRGAYLKFLSNPYDTSFEIGYVFLFYYGLERFLLTDKFEDAFELILKLRDTYDNNSFQYYSGNSLILSCIYHQRPDMMIKFIYSLDKEYELSFSANLFLLCVYSFDIPVDSKDIIRLRNDFEFRNNSYISKYPDMFDEIMTELIKHNYENESILLSDVLSKSQFNKLKLEDVNMFANISISDNMVKVPLISDSFMLKKTFHDILVVTQEIVRTRVAELRKTGDVSVPNQKSNSNANKAMTFDLKEEKRLLEELKNNYEDPVQRHFSYDQLQNFYYKYRNLDYKYLEKCIKYCEEDIDGLVDMQRSYIAMNLDKLEHISSIYNEEELESMTRDIKDGYRVNIPAFKKLSIIYEKNKKYDRAVDICLMAIGYYERLSMDTSDFEDRKEKLLNKIKINDENVKENIDQID